MTAILWIGLLGAPGLADVLEVRRPATIRAEPIQTAEELARPEVGTLLELVEDEPRAGYYQVEIPGEEGSGWIYRTLVRRVAPDTRAAERVRDGFGVQPPSLAPPTAASVIVVPELSDEERQFAERHLEIGRPQVIHERYRSGYVTAVDARLKIPVWVQYQLSAAELEGPGVRSDNFRDDRSLPALARAGLEDYRSSGFDRGHLAPAADMKRSQPVMNESFLLSNIAPQVGIGFNRHIWAELEAATRRWVQQRGSLTIIAGPIFEVVFDDDEVSRVSYRVIGENQVAVPTAFFKIVVDHNRPGQTEVLAFIIPNQRHQGRTIREFLVTVAEIEGKTGIDFLSAMPREEQEIVETRRPGDVWPLEPVVVPPDEEELIAAEPDPLARINLNTATREELETLPGIGSVLAERILARRPYRSVNDLIEVNGIGEARLNLLRPLVTAE